MARMTSSPAIARTALSGKEWRVLILLVISALINYIDRTTLSVAATDIQRELHLTNTQVGALQSAFFASYALCQLSFVAGWVVGRFHVGWVLGFGFLLWSGATAITGAATVFAMIFALRLLLGIGESVSYPSYSRILASEYPEHHRGFANALIDAGTKVGPALGILIGGLLVSSIGMADLLHRPRRRQPLVADSVGRVDAARQERGVARGCIRDPLHRRDSERAVRLVHRLRPLLRQLLLVLPDHLAAGLPGKGAPLPQNQDGLIRLVSVRGDRSFEPCFSAG